VLKRKERGRWRVEARSRLISYTYMWQPKKQAVVILCLVVLVVATMYRLGVRLARARGGARALVPNNNQTASHVVFLALYSGDRADAARAEATWFSGDKGRVAFGVYSEEDARTVRCVSPWRQASAFVNVQAAFMRASECYPRGEHFVRLNIGADPAAAAALVSQAAPGIDYLGHPIRSGGLAFASGPDGYVLSMKAVQRLKNCTPSAQFDGFEDSGVGECLWRSGIEFTRAASNPLNLLSVPHSPA
jgi:hypothetical protein